MTIEFTQQSLDDDGDDTDDSVIIPRVSKTEMKTTKLSKLAPMEFCHYGGPTSHEVHQGIPFQDIVKVNKDIKAALQMDVEWLCSVVKDSRR